MIVLGREDLHSQKHGGGEDDTVLLLITRSSTLAKKMLMYENQETDDSFRAIPRSRRRCFCGAFRPLAFPLVLMFAKLTTRDNAEAAPAPDTPPKRQADVHPGMPGGILTSPISLLPVYAVSGPAKHDRSKVVAAAARGSWWRGSSCPGTPVLFKDP